MAFSSGFATIFVTAVRRIEASVDIEGGIRRSLRSLSAASCRGGCNAQSLFARKSIAGTRQGRRKGSTRSATVRKTRAKIRADDGLTLDARLEGFVGNGTLADGHDDLAKHGGQQEIKILGGTLAHKIVAQAAAVGPKQTLEPALQGFPLLFVQILHQPFLMAQHHQMGDEGVWRADAHFIGQEAVAVGKDQDKEEHGAKLLKDGLVLALIVIVAPVVEELAKRLEQRVRLFKEKQDVEGQWLADELIAEVLEGHRLFVLAEAAEDLGQGLADGADVAVHVVQLAHQRRGSLKIRPAFGNQRFLGVPATAGQGLVGILPKNGLYAGLRKKPVQAAGKAKVFPHAVGKVVVAAGARVIKHGRHGRERVGVNVAQGRGNAALCRVAVERGYELGEKNGHLVDDEGA